MSSFSSRSGASSVVKPRDSASQISCAPSRSSATLTLIDRRNERLSATSSSSGRSHSRPDTRERVTRWGEEVRSEREGSSVVSRSSSICSDGSGQSRRDIAYEGGTRAALQRIDPHALTRRRSMELARIAPSSISRTPDHSQSSLRSERSDSTIRPYRHEPSISRSPTTSVSRASGATHRSTTSQRSVSTVRPQRSENRRYSSGRSDYTPATTSEAPHRTTGLAGGHIRRGHEDDRSEFSRATSDSRTGPSQYHDDSSIVSSSSIGTGRFSSRTHSNHRSYASRSSHNRDCRDWCDRNPGSYAPWNRYDDSETVIENGRVVYDERETYRSRLR